MAGLQEEIKDTVLDELEKSDWQRYRKKANGLVKDFILVGVGIAITLAVLGLIKVFI